MDGRKGHKSIHCDGFCQQRSHRKGAGLFKTAFEIVSAPDYGPYFCFGCRLDALSKEIVRLKDSVSSLTSELQNIKASMCLNVSIPKLTRPQPDQHKPKGYTSKTPNSSPKSYSTAVSSNASGASLTSARNPTAPTPLPSSSSSATDGKFNVVLYGIPVLMGLKRFRGLLMILHKFQ